MLGFAEIDEAPFSGYLEAFRHGVPPHGGFALGVERLIRQLVNLLDISERVVMSVMHRGAMGAFVSDHRIVDITRTDVLRWLNRRLEESR